MLVAFDTATPQVSVALHDGTKVLAQSHPAVDARRHGELLAPTIAELLAQVGIGAADLTGVAVGVGPGPFTSLRAGIVTAETMGFALDIPVYGVGTLDALALAAHRSGAVESGQEFLVATDARRAEVYWARFRAEPGLPQRLTEPAVAKAATIPRAALAVVGRGALLYPEALGPPVGPLDPLGPQVADWALLALAAGLPVRDLSPQYLRRPDIHPGAPRKSVLG
ncbi:MAG: tRNA (adenosine(37)-N6)-threonylcarbamoyltransferase complex dimerization subunit type 1 TsaB [Angustibacter sp.]